jgi:CRISPR-associated protein (TIGR03986 family)
MTLPQQTLHVREDREALAPYNFVPLPERVVPAEPRLTHDRYHEGRHTGRIECTLTTASPLYVRSGLTLEQLQAGLEAKDVPDFFALHQAGSPVIPGSSLRGMLRAMVEIAGYGKMEKVTDRPRFFYRAVASRGEDPLAGPYRSQLRNVKAGVIVRQGDAWRIKQVRPINGETFIKVREQDIPRSVGLVPLNSPDYRIQVIPVSFTVKRLKPSPRAPQGRTVIDLIDKPGVHAASGWLVTSGNMLETNRGQQRSPRRSHAVVPEPGEASLPIAAAAVDDYLNGLSDFQLEQLGPKGVLQDGRPVFYCEPPRGETDVVYFGHSPNFRLPFRFPGSTRAATPLDFVPEALRDDATIDLAEAIFGMVRRQKQAGEAPPAIAGRVFVGDATVTPGQQDIWYSDEPITPRILATPKPTTFQHYLVQPTDRLGALKHYGSAPASETVIRGHKLYWRKDAQPDIRLPEEQQRISDTQKTTIRPVRAGVSFEFTMHYENLSDVELGALLWVLRLAADERYRLSLGMGKPLGMGAISVRHKVWGSDRGARYKELFSSSDWFDGEHRVDPEEIEGYVRAFEEYVLRESGEAAKGTAQLRDALRIRCLLALLAWSGPPLTQTRYLEIERDPRQGVISAADVRGRSANEYKNRPVLPDARAVAGVLGESDRLPKQPGTDAGVTTPTTEPSARPATPQLPAVGTVYRAEIIAADESAVIVRVPGFTPEQAFGRMTDEVLGERIRNYRVGNQARVEVVSMRQAKSGRYILELKPAPREQSGS